MRFARFLHFFILAFIAGCGGVSVLPEPFTRQRIDGKIPVKAELIRQQVRAELGGMLEGEAEVARWQTIETDYNKCRLASARATKTEAEEVFSVCMSEKGYVYMIPIDAEQFHNDVAFEIRKAKDAADKAAEEKRLENDLRVYARDGNLSEVRRLLASGVNPNAAEKKYGNTALMLAAGKGHTEIAKALLDGDANPNAKSKDGWTALLDAAVKGHTEIVKALLGGGANPDAANKDGSTALTWAAKKRHTEIIKILLDGGANPDAANKVEEERFSAQKRAMENRIAAMKREKQKRDDEALMVAANNGHTETVKALLGGGANPNVADKDGWTALIVAAGNGHTEIAKALLGGGASPNAAEKDGWTALMWAANKGHAEVAKALLGGGANPNAADKDGVTALIRAANNGHTEIAKALLGGGANPNAADNGGGVLLRDTALMRAASNGHTEIVKLLLSAGASTNRQNELRDTALMLAAIERHAEIVKLLLSAGAITNQQNKNDWTALYMAAQREHPDIAELLLSCGANPNLKGQHNYTAWDWARENVTVLPVFEKYQRKLNSGWRPQSCKERWWSPSRSEVGGKIAVSPSANPPKNTNIAETVFKNVWRSIVVIKSGKKQGSGVIVRPNIVATNCHVLGGGKITVYKHNNRRASTDTLFSATVRKRDSKNDFCLLDVSGLSGISVSIRRYNTLKIGEDVYALGSPKGLDLSLSSGLISQLRQGGGERIIQTDAAISPGSSGGGLFDSEGNLIGITTAVHKDAENVGFAIPADLALGL